MNLEAGIYQILKNHKLTIKKREEVIVDLLGFIKKEQAEQLILSGVSQQRELLNSFQKHYQSDGYDDEMSFDWNISNFLKAFNCG